jgi:Tol biopolymer transport system component
LSPDERRSEVCVKKWIIIGVIIAVVVIASVGAVGYVVLQQTWSKPDVVESMVQVPNAEGVVRARWSPDGDRILYESYESSGIWITNADGTNQVHLAEGNSPVWSPDGSLVAFVSDDGIELMSPDATGRRLLVSPTALAPEPAEGGSIGLGAPAWSPDGGKIAFELGSYVPDPFDPSDPWRQTGTSLSSIWIINSDGSDPKRLTTDSAYEQGPYWSLDGQSITFSSNRNDGKYAMWTSRVDGNGQPELAEGGVLSPDGTRVAYLTEDEDLWLKDADGGNAVEVAGGSAWYQNWAWSPDGTMLAFDSTIVGPVGNIWIVNANGTGKTKLTGATRDLFDCTPELLKYKEPQWSPDGTKLLFLNGLDKGNTLWGCDRLWVMELSFEKGLG